MFSTRFSTRSTIGLLLAFAITAALAVALLGAASSSAQAGLGCPEGFVPSSDGNGCVSEPQGALNENVTTTTSCLQGVLSADGTQCVVPRLDAPAPVGTRAASSPAVTSPPQAFTG